MSLSEHDVIQPGKPRRSLRQWLRKFLPVLIALLVAAGLSAGVLLYPNDDEHFDGVVGSGVTQSASAEPAIVVFELTTSQEVVVTNGKIAQIPGSFYNDSKPGDRVPTGKVRDEVVRFGLNDAQALRLWRLCWAELHAQAQYYSDRAAAFRKYPNDGFTEDEKNRPEVNLEYAAFYEMWSQVYETAANLAGDQQIPCTDGGKETSLRYVTFHIVVDGVKRAPAISSYEVLDDVLPLESHLLTGNTVSKERQRLAQIEASVIKPPSGTLYIDSNLRKAINVAESKATIAMLQEEPGTRN
jgi:hypothetical protein